MKIPRPCGMLLLPLFATVLSLNGQVALYEFGGTSSGTASATSTAPNITAGDFTVGGDVAFTLGTTSPASSGNGIGGSGGGTFRSKGDGYKPAEFTPGYMEVTFTLASGFQLDVTSVTFNTYSTSTGPSHWELQASVDGGSFSNIQTGTNPGSSTWAQQSTGSITLTGISTRVTFRLFGTGASSSAGAFNLDDFALNGSIIASSVPEPSSYALLAGLATLAVSTGLRRRSRRLAA